MFSEPENLTINTTANANLTAACAMAIYAQSCLPIKKRYLYDIQEKSQLHCLTQQLPKQQQQQPPSPVKCADVKCTAAPHNHPSANNQNEALDLCVYRCRVCLKCFKANDRLKAHMRRHEIKASKRYTCGYCKKSFVQQSSLITHKRIHTGEKPFYCQACGKSYGDQSTFTKHTRTHTGEKPYSCNQCYQKFSQSGNLSRHKKSVHNIRK